MDLPRIQKATIVDTQTSSFTVYIIEVKIEGCNIHTIVRRRFSEFYEFHKKLQEKYPKMKFRIPHRQAFGQLEPHIIDWRKDLFQNFLNSITFNCPDLFLSFDKIVYSFLAPHLLVSGASDDKPSLFDDFAKLLFGQDEKRINKREVTNKLDSPKDVLAACIVNCLSLFLSLFELDDLLSIAHINHAFFNHCSLFISENFYFTQEISYPPYSKSETKKTCNFYKPKKMIVHKGDQVKNAEGIPHGVTHVIYIVKFFSNPRLNTFFPSSISHLSFGDLMNSINITSLPLSLTHLSFSHFYKTDDDCDLGSILPLSLTHLSLSNDYNQQILSLPPNLLSINFGISYEYDFSPILPSSLTSLTFGGSPSLSKNLPENLLYLNIFSAKRDFQIGTLPSSLTSLTLPIYFDSFFIPPPSLKYLHARNLSQCEFGCLSSSSSLLELFVDKFGHPYSSLPSSLKILTMSDTEPILPHSLPSSLSVLTLGYHYNSPLSHLPSSLTKLILGNAFNQSVDSLPSSLLYLSLGQSFNQPLDSLPSSLKILFSGDSFNHPIPSLPLSLRELTLGNSFNFPIDSLPLSLSHLSIGNDFNHPINSLPLSLTHLMLGRYFNQSVDSLPLSLSYLILGDSFDRTINYLPPSISFLILGQRFDQPVNNLPQLSLLMFLNANYSQPFDNLPSSIRKIITFANNYPTIPEHLSHAKHVKWSLGAPIKIGSTWAEIQKIQKI